MRPLHLVALLSVTSLGLALSQGCSSSDEKSPPNTSETNVVGRAFAATKCGYDIVVRDEFEQVFFPTNDAELATGKVSSEAGTIKRIRLGLGGKVDLTEPAKVDPSTSVAFVWETDVETDVSTARWGKSPDPATWDTADLVDGLSYVVKPPALTPNGIDQRVHEAHVCGLEPDTTYYYQVGSIFGGKTNMSDVRSFRTLPVQGADSPVTVAITGDSRGELNNAWQILQERLYKRGDIQLQLFSGDMIDVPLFQGEFLSWLDNFERDTAGKPSMGGQVLTLVAMGNHENYQSQFFASVVQPTDKQRQEAFGELYFSFDTGPLHIIVMDDFAIAKPGALKGYRENVLAWLEADLTEATSRPQRPWIVVTHHHGEWSAANHGDDPSSLRVRETLTPIWDKYGVELVVAGHDHNYERSRKLKLDAEGKPVFGSGTTYIVCAGAGAPGYGNGNEDFTETSLSYKNEGAIGVYGVMKATREKLAFETRLLTAAGDDPVKDSFTLTR